MYYNFLHNKILVDKNLTMNNVKPCRIMLVSKHFLLINENHSFKYVDVYSKSKGINMFANITNINLNAIE